MASREERFSNKLFLNAVLPLLKVIATDDPKQAKKFAHMHAVVQISALDPESPQGKSGTHFVINSGNWLVHNDKLTRDPHVELEFKSIEAMNAFFKGDMKQLPKMKGVLKNPGVFVSVLMLLLRMSSLLSAKEPPAEEENKQLMVKCYFYLLTSGISQLNKLGHDAIHDWTSKSPDRVYALDIVGHPEVAAYIRIKAGKSRAGRGMYTRAMPFFTLQFDSFDSALGILLGTDDMMDATKARRLIMDGAPEFGAQFGGFLLDVGSFVQ